MDLTRKEIFNQLRPICVALLQAATEYSNGKAKKSEVISAVRPLVKALKLLALPSLPFDAGLADYVFVPLSLILKNLDTFTGSLVELLLECLLQLITAGWAHKMPPELAKQLFVLFSVAATGKDSDDRAYVSEEQERLAYECLAAVFRALKRTVTTTEASLLTEENVPALGHVLTVLLDGMGDDRTVEVQVAAVRALKDLRLYLRDRKILMTFFPGMVSATTRSLMPNSKSRRNSFFLVEALSFLTDLLTAVLGDIEGVGRDKSVDQEEWFKETAEKVKFALANVIKLQSQAKPEVRRALLQLCVAVVDECAASLESSMEMMVHTMLVLAGREQADGSTEAKDVIERLGFSDNKVVSAVETFVHQRLVALPRSVQAADPDTVHAYLSQLSVSLSILESLSVESSVIEDTLLSTLKDTVLEIVSSQKTQKTHTLETQEEVVHSKALLGLDANSEQAFNSVLTSNLLQKKAVSHLESFLADLSRTGSALQVARQATDYCQGSVGNEKASWMWLALNAARISLNSSGNEEADQWLVSDEQPDSALLTTIEDLYFESLNVLSSDDEIDEITEETTRINALALEAITLESQVLGEAFREDLVDALFPVVHLLGSLSPALRSHAQISLNKIAENCGYSTASDLIIQNADYLVNALALKLNSFNITPQAPIILLMMVKLAGPRLIPYLDDMIESIFAALDNFHGYPKLVELLFMGLEGIVEVDAGELRERSIEGIPNHKKQAAKHITMEEAMLQLTTPRQPLVLPEDQDTTPKKGDKDEDEDEETNEHGEQAADQSKEKEVILPKAHALVSRILSNVIPHLSSSSPNLRRKLLILTTTALPRLSTHDDTFLPLIASLWLPITRRLQDPEPYIREVSLQTISTMIVTTGDFLASRITDDTFWSLLMKIYRESAQKLTVETKNGKLKVSPYSNIFKIREALFQVFEDIVSHVRLPDALFDELLLAVVGVLEERVSLSEAMEIVNPDAVFMALEVHVHHGERLRSPPIIPSFTFARYVK